MPDPIELAREYASRPELWEHLVHHDPGQRTFELLRDDDEVTAWVICWMEDHDTGFHDHDVSTRRGGGGAGTGGGGAVATQRTAREAGRRAGRRLRLLARRHPPRPSRGRAARRD